MQTSQTEAQRLKSRVGAGTDVRVTERQAGEVKLRFREAEMLDREADSSG